MGQLKIYHFKDTPILADPRQKPQAYVYKQKERARVGDMSQVIISQSVSQNGNGGDWPDNEPQGLVQLVYGNGSNKYFDGNASYGTRWQDDYYVEVVSDANSKFGSAIEKRFFIGDGSGFKGIVYCDNWANEYKEVYFRLVFKYSSNWQFHDSGEKFWYWGEEDVAGATSFYTASRTGSHVVQWRCQSNNGGSGCSIWISDDQISRGEYHTLEHHAVAQSSSGASDGSFTTWFDGNVVLSGSGIQLLKSGVSPNFDGYEGLLYWGGSGDTKTVNDWIRFSEFKISGKVA